MATKRSKSKAPKSIDVVDPPSKETEAAKKLVKRVRDRYKVMKEADEDNRKKAMADFKFINVPGEQWDQTMKTQRGQRPCYEFNELRIKCKRVINDMRANRPQAKVRGYEDNDVDTAEILEGLGRNIWNCSDADTTVDNAGEYQVGAGMGAWRIVTDYESDMSFDQDIYIEGIKNPFCLYADPAAKDPLKRDARDWVLTEKIPRTVYDDTYSDKKAVSFDADENDDDDDWGTDKESEEVRIAEYWYKEPITVELWLLKDGKVVDSTDEAAKQIPQDQIAKKRTAKSHKIMMAIVSGNAVLEGPLECAGKEHRFVQVFGESLVIDGKTIWHGLGRFAKDAQRNLNITQTAALESTAASLQSKYWSTLKQAEGLSEKWAEAIQKNLPIQYYNPDPMAPGPPQRMAGAEIPVAMLQLGQQASQLMKSVTGIFDASLGERSNENSGRAIIARQQQGEIATFNYQDNMAKAVQRTWEILLDLIPEVYDTERTIRVLGADGAEKYKKINTFEPNPEDPTNPLKVNDLRQGKYDVTITVGPNFQTLRQEAAETWAQMASSDPNLMVAAGDLVYKSMDVPYAEQIAERMKVMLPQPIQQMLQQDDQKIPPEARQALMQADQAMQIVQQQTKLIEAAHQEVAQEKADADKAKSEVQTAIANLETKRAQFEATIAKQTADLAIKEAQFNAAQGQDNMGRERETLQTEITNAIAEINKSLAEYMQQQAGVLADIMGKQQTQVIVPPRPKLVAVNMEKANGKTRAVPVYEGDAMAMQ